MSTVTINQLSLMEIAKRVHNGKFEPIAETLAETNDIITDAAWMPANDLTSHVLTRQQLLPNGSYKKPRKGTVAEGGKTNQLREEVAELYGRSPVDEQELNKAPDKAQARHDEDMLFIEGLSQTSAYDIIYGNNGADPEKLMGFANRPEWDALADANVIGQGGTGSDLASLWILQWGARAITLRYPMNQKLGIQWEDLGRQPVVDGDGNTYDAMVSRFIISFALAIMDIRNAQRIANIETAGSSNTLDDDNIIRSLNKMPQRGRNAHMYVNRTIMSQLDIIGKDQNNIYYEPSEFGGRPTMFYRAVPVGLHEQLLDTETAIT